MSDDELPAFDDDVVRAMARWPDVPRCYGWLGLDRRGAWRIRGERITHRRAIDFLGRHYRADADGCWYVQNGPQQVFVELAYTPWVYRFDAHRGFVTHTGIASAGPRAVLRDDEGNLLIDTALGVGLVDDRDLEACSRLLEIVDEEAVALHWRGQRLTVGDIARSAVPAAFGFEPHPRE